MYFDYTPAQILLEFAVMRTTAWIVLAVLLLPMSAGAWGEKGHALISMLAIEGAAPKLPEFMGASRDHLIYNANEPDRWREEGHTSVMNLVQAPDHFFDSELWGPISTIEADRYSFMEKLAARKIALIKVGYLPYAMIENYQKLVNAFRFWRNAKTAEDRESVRQNAVYVAGVLSHYVGDGAMPMHLSIHYNGWLDNRPNPKNYTKDRGFHGRYESAYVNASIDISAVRPKMQAPRRLTSVWESVKQYLSVSFADLEPAYELEKAGEFNPDRPRPKGTDFIANQLGRASMMLSNLWYTAWLESSEPVPGQNPKE
jgi:hypothetical protein